MPQSCAIRVSFLPYLAALNTITSIGEQDTSNTVLKQAWFSRNWPPTENTNQRIQLVIACIVDIIVLQDTSNTVLKQAWFSRNWPRTENTNQRIQQVIACIVDIIVFKNAQVSACAIDFSDTVQDTLDTVCPQHYKYNINTTYN